MKISEYTQIDNITNDSIFPIEQSGGTKRATIKDIYDFFNKVTVKELTKNSKIEWNDSKYIQCGKIIVVTVDFKIKAGETITSTDTLFSGLPMTVGSVFFVVHKYTTSESRRLRFGGDGKIYNVYETLTGDGLSYSGSVVSVTL